MLFRKKFLDGIQAGEVTLAYRRWRRPTVRSGGTLLTPAGQLSIASVEPVSMGQISNADARRAGYGNREELLGELLRKAGGEVYRIELGPLRADPRIALRQSGLVDEGDLRTLRGRLRRFDAHAPEGPWTRRTLEALRTSPGVRAADVCGLVGQGKERFKLNVRKLKALGLTESLGTGYRLSPRGEALLGCLQTDPR